MIIGMKITPATIFLGMSGICAILLGWITSARNLLGWTLVVWGIGLLVESLGLSHHLWHPEEVSRRNKTLKGKLTMAGILAVSIIPALDFLALPAMLPRTPGMQDAGLILCALGLLILLRSKISWEFWIREDVLAPAIRREIDRGPNHANRLLEFAGVMLWTVGICLGFGSLLGVAAMLLLLAPGFIPQKY
jgi:hypothetical protein